MLTPVDDVPLRGADMNAKEIAARLAGLDWATIEAAVREQGYARTPKLLSAAECRSLIALYPDDGRFRSRVDMARHRFGEGDYAYFAEPLPPLVAALRAAFYRRLAPMANRMNEELGREARYPPTLQAYRRRCRAAGQSKPTPLLLHYRAGGYNRLHRDLDGPLTFPLQAALMLSRPGVDF
ncbi:MAG: 2OG-Fe(II) oxygenase, partial [Alphaproteobacteria bacterium]